MNINVKNCEVNIITGTETLEIKGKPQSAAPADEGVISTQYTYSMAGFMANRDKVKIGDRIRVPGFKVPAVKIGGENKLKFDEIEVVGEYATVYRIEGEQISLVFDRSLFQSAIDRNDTSVFEETQLAAYLRGAFLDALRKETSATDCGLLRKEELWGDNALPFFRNGRNRVCFKKDEDSSVWYWTETVEEASAAGFCCAGGKGGSTYCYASSASGCVRPRFIMSAI